MKAFVLSFLAFLLFLPQAHAQICIDSRVIASVASALVNSPQKKKEPEVQIRQRVAQPRYAPQATHLGTLPDGVTIPAAHAPAPPSDQDRYEAARAAQRRQIQTPPQRTVQRSRTFSNRPTGRRSSRSSGSLAQTLSTSLGTSSCSGICF